MWGQIERFTKASAKRARNLPQFIESLKPRLACETINPRAMQTSADGQIWYRDGSEPPVVDVQEPGDSREFLTAILAAADERAVLDRLYRETSYVILLVRDRLERERPIESRINRQLEESS